MSAASILALAGCGSTLTNRPAPLRAPRCRVAAYLPAWACLPIKRPALRRLTVVDGKRFATRDGQQTRVYGQVLQLAPIDWSAGRATQVAVRVETPLSWLRGRIAAEHLRIVLKKGTRLYASPTGPQVGLLIADLTVGPLLRRVDDRIGFEVHLPSASSSPALLLWAAMARFRHDATGRDVPRDWVVGGQQAPAKLRARLGTPLRLTVRGPRLPWRHDKETTVLPRCANAPPRIRVLELETSKARIAVRLIDGYTQRLGAIVLRGWTPLLPPPEQRSGRYAVRIRLNCAFYGRRQKRWEWSSGGAHTTRAPLPLYTTTDPRGAPIGVLSKGARVEVGAAQIVAAGRRRFLQVHAQGLPLYVPYRPELFSAAPLGPVQK